MKVSIITVCFNSEKYLERAIQSVLSQDYGNIEYVIIDGGSKDGTLDILGKYKNRINKLISEPDDGVFDAMNKGIKKSTGELICFINSDDYFYSNNIVEKAVEFFLERKDLDFIYGDLMYKDPITNKMWRYNYPRFLTKMHFVNDSVSHPAAFFRRNVFDKVGYYDTQFKISSDREWFLRALYKRGIRAAHIGHIVAVFQYGGMSNKAAYRELHSIEKKKVLDMYFNPFEVRIGRFFNFIFSGNIFRRIAMFIFRSKGYNFLKNIKRNLFYRAKKT